MFAAYIMVLVIVMQVAFVVFACMQKAACLYDCAKEKHRNEHLQLYFFIGSRYYATGITFRRCYSPLFDIFNGLYCGFTFEGVQVLVYNNNSKILICERDDSRKTLAYYDIGAGGMIAYPDTPDITASEELHEELGIQTQIKKIKTVTPAHGYTCIIHIYETYITDQKLVSEDGTYVDFMFYDINAIPKNIFANIKTDGQKMLQFI